MRVRHKLTIATRRMLTLRHSSAIDLLDRLVQHLSHQHQGAERLPAAEVPQTFEAYAITFELPRVDPNAINMKAPDRTLVISTDSPDQRQLHAPRPAPRATVPRARKHRPRPNLPSTQRAPLRHLELQLSLLRSDRAAATQRGVPGRTGDRVGPQGQQADHRFGEDRRLIPR
jgi:hypothetical protein